MRRPRRAGHERSGGRQALELGARLTLGRSCGIVFFGGEPLLAPDVIQSTVAHARFLEGQGAARFHFKITTNGLLLDETFLDFAVANDILVAMSFDGVREAHDRHRRLPNGAPHRRPRPATPPAARPAPYSSVMLVVNPDTAPHLADSVRYLLDVGARYLIVSLNYAAEWSEEHFAVLEDSTARLRTLRRVDARRGGSSTSAPSR